MTPAAAPPVNNCHGAHVDCDHARGLDNDERRDQESLKHFICPDGRECLSALQKNDAIQRLSILRSPAATAPPPRWSGRTGPPSDTYGLAATTGRALVKQGGDTWFFITADYAFGHALERDTTGFVTAGGGKVLGAVRHPINTADFSSYLRQAQASKAKVIAFANAGGDTINAIKQAAEFGLGRGGDQRLAALLLQFPDTHALGLEAAGGLIASETFFWDLDDKTRASRRA
jgi:ABC-type branched-subunit amino acid transport system substrate-binding protein